MWQRVGLFIRSIEVAYDVELRNSKIDFIKYIPAPAALLIGYASVVNNPSLAKITIGSYIIVKIIVVYLYYSEWRFAKTY